MSADYAREIDLVLVDGCITDFNAPSILDPTVNNAWIRNQWGYMRRIDGNGDGLANPDIGAYELGVTADSTSSSTLCGDISTPVPSTGSES